MYIERRGASSGFIYARALSLFLSRVTLFPPFFYGVGYHRDEANSMYALKVLSEEPSNFMERDLLCSQQCRIYEYIDT